MMFTRSFIISWILSAILMFGLSYGWHGIFLNDISTQNYPVGIYLFSSGIVYLIVGLVLTLIFSSQFVIHAIPNLFLRGLACGSTLGIVLYMFALVIGVSFTKTVTLTSIAVDIPWQIFEQCFGGLIIATVFALIYEPIPFNRSEDKI